MSSVGRNDPCPCGSGKKFKKCCLGKQDAAVPFTARDRESALVRLAEFAFRDDLDEERLVAGVAFWSGWLDAHPEDEGRPGMDMEESIHAFGSWFAFDFRLANGQTVLERMLQREVARLTRGEREYLVRMRDTHLRPYQVTDVKADEGLRLIDLWTGEQVWVRERLGSSQLVRWDLLAVRLTRGADEDLVIDGQPYPYPVRSKPDQPLPALGNRTPREAARLKRVRPTLVALLQEFENMSARERLDGRPAYDFAWMWAELGLSDRDEPGKDGYPVSGPRRSVTSDVAGPCERAGRQLLRRTPDDP